MRNKDQQAGIDFENEFNKKIGGKLVPGSGSRWHSKLDVNGKSILWSLKCTKFDSFRMTKDLLWEAITAVSGPGGKGSSTYPGMAVRMGSEDFVVMRLSDFMEIFTEEEKIFKTDKTHAKKKAAMTPKFNRSEQESEVL